MLALAFGWFGFDRHQFDVRPESELELLWLDVDVDGDGPLAIFVAWRTAHAARALLIHEVW